MFDFSSHFQVLDDIRLNFTAGSLFVMNIIIAFIMFGISLNIKISEFKEVLTKPKAFIVGIISQFMLLPLVTFLLVKIINPSPSVALGMILVAACPGGNVSNFISYISKGNLSLSVMLTSFSTITCVILTPFNFWFYGSLYSRGIDIPWVSISFWEMFQTAILLIGLPVVLGIIVGKYFPKFKEKAKKPVSWLSIAILALFIAMALKNNFNYFIQYIHLIFILVLLHNGIAYLSGYLAGKVSRLDRRDVKTITIETGIQNSGLGLILIFNPHLFAGNGGMAFVAAWWGIWHIAAGFAIAGLSRWRDRKLIKREKL
ncbi:symporter [Bacteroidia bacterium]|nr:symporter [Bacteroidia bacterium]